MNEIILQGIGFVGVALFIVSYQIKSNRTLFILQLSGCIAFCIQFFLMGAFTGAISLIINIVRNVLLIKANEWKWARSKITMCIIILLLIAVTVFTWAGAESLLPLASVTVTTVGYWTHNGQKIRLSQLFGSPCYLIYDVIVHSWGGVVSESVAIISILVSIHRFGWKELAKETS
ncbi:MAG: YgjV family protein [Ruminiclostridium sp.]|nr:YgjV family protein [Ruminiclostridium sp.]